MNSREEITFYKKNHFWIFPKTVQIEITEECPFHCPQCYKINMEKRSMSFETIKSYIEMGVKHNVRLMVLNGGEPLMHPDFIRILEVVRENANIEFNCFSSGFSLNDEKIDMIKKCKNFNFFISLNGSTKKINDYSREGYDISIRAIQMLTDAECDFGINWVARKDNIDDFENMIALAKCQNAKELSVTSNKLIGSSREVIELDASDLERLAVMIQKETSLPISVEACFPQLVSLMRANRESDGCAAGRYNICIDLDGNYSPCTHLHYVETWDSIEEYWMNSEVLKNLRENAICNLCDRKCHYCRATTAEGYQHFEAGMSNCCYREKIRQ